MKTGKITITEDALRQMIIANIRNFNLEEFISRLIDQLIYGDTLEYAIDEDLTMIADRNDIEVPEHLKPLIIQGIKEELTRTINYDDVVNSMVECATYEVNK